MVENWREIPGYEGLYAVSDMGRVKNSRSGKILAPVVKSSGYLAVCLSKDGQHKLKTIHRLVLLAFVGPCPPGMETRHFPDHDKKNNRLDNLQWGNAQENADDRKARNRVPEPNPGIAMTLLKPAQVAEILGISVDSVTKLVKAGLLTALRVGAKPQSPFRFRLEDVEKYIASAAKGVHK